MAKPRTRTGRKPSEERLLFGTAEEVTNRSLETALYSEGGDPEVHAPSFKQISPEHGSGSVNRAPLARRSGEMKFSGGPGKI